MAQVYGVNHPDDHVLQVAAVPDMYAELEDWLALPREPWVSDPLKFARYHSDRFPTIFGLCEEYLSIPASSAAVERLFSTAGNVLSDLRLSLSDHIAACIMFLHQNRRWFWSYKGDNGNMLPPLVDQLRAAFNGRRAAEL
jgi:hypothetical protein